MGHGWRTASATVLAFGLTGGAAAETRPSIAVVVHNQSAVSDDCIARAKADVVRIYGDAGVDVLWMDPAMVMPVPTFTIRLLIRPRPIEAQGRIMGTAIGATHDTSGSAFVFYQEVLKTAHDRQQDVARVLAYAMAHEMGHLMLPAPAHAASGIMRADWNGDDFRHIADGSLAFTPEQARAIQTKVVVAAQSPIPNPQSPFLESH